MLLVIGNTVKATKDIVIDKYHHGYVVFPEGSLFTFDGFEKTGLNMVFTPLENIDVEQPKSVILSEGEFAIVERDVVVNQVVANKELLLNCLSSINPDKFDIKISRTPDYSFVEHSVDTPLRLITYITIISGNFTATISSNDHCSFSVYGGENIFEHKSYVVEHVGLFKEAYSIIKPLLLIEV